MTPTDEQLIKWSAEVLMGWAVDAQKRYYITTNEPPYGNLKIKSDILGWNPLDKNDQIWDCVEKMRERGYLLRFSVWSDEYQAWFTTNLKAYPDYYNNNHCRAILLAAWRAVEGEKL